MVLYIENHPDEDGMQNINLIPFLIWFGMRNVEF